MIPMNDFRRAWDELGPELADAFAAFGASGHYILGAEVAAFERALAERWRRPFAIGVANGMDAIEIGLRVLGLRPGDRVLTTPLSAFATTLAILRAGGQPVFADVDEQGLIDLDAADAVLRRESSIRFFVPVHLYGLPLDRDRLAELKRRHDLKIVEDCAQSIDAESRGADGQFQPTGHVGQVIATSFYPTKNLGALGDGGALLVEDEIHDAHARRLRNYGQSERYVHVEAGLNSRLDELQAYLLRRAILPRLSAWTERRREIAGAYLRGIDHPAVRLVAERAEDHPCWHLFPIFVRGGEAPRARLATHLHQSGVASGFHYPIAIPDQTAMRGGPTVEVPKAVRLAKSQISLPIHPYLTDAEVGTVIDSLNSFPEG